MKISCCRYNWWDRQDTVCSKLERISTQSLGLSLDLELVQHLMISTPNSLTSETIDQVSAIFICIGEALDLGKIITLSYRYVRKDAVHFPFIDIKDLDCCLIYDSILGRDNFLLLIRI